MHEEVKVKLVGCSPESQVPVLAASEKEFGVLHEAKGFYDIKHSSTSSR